MELLKNKFEVESEYLYYLENLCVPRRAVLDLLYLARDTSIAGLLEFKKSFDHLDKFHWKHKPKAVGSYYNGYQSSQQEEYYRGKTLNDPTALQLSCLQVPD